MIRVMLNFNNYREKIGKKFSIIYILIDLRRKVKENFVFVTKTETPRMNIRLKQIHLRFFKPSKRCIQLKTDDLGSLNKLVS